MGDLNRSTLVEGAVAVLGPSALHVLHLLPCPRSQLASPENRVRIRHSRAGREILGYPAGPLLDEMIVYCARRTCSNPGAVILTYCLRSAASAGRARRAFGTTREGRLEHWAILVLHRPFKRRGTCLLEWSGRTVGDVGRHCLSTDCGPPPLRRTENTCF